MDKTIPIIPVATGEVFLQDKLEIPDKCYICKQPVDPYNNEDAPLIRIKPGVLGLCHLYHPGVVQEYVKQYGAYPEGWTKDD